MVTRLAIDHVGEREPPFETSREQRDRLAHRFFAAFERATLSPVEVNGEPGAVTLDSEGRLITVIALDIEGGKIQALNSVVNPELCRSGGRRLGGAPLRP